MMNVLTPLLSLFSSSQKLPEGSEKVLGAFTDFIQRDDKAKALVASYIEQARQHDIATFDKSDKFTNRIRSLVRPVCTLLTLSWYIYARVMGIPLTPEDYTLIGGVVAFWFGVRSLEKR